MNHHVMPRVVLLCLAGILGTLAPASALAQQRLLRLEVWRLDNEGQKQPAQGASVSLLGYGNPTRVQPPGQAQLFLPPALEPGAPLSLHVSLEGYQLFLPFEGRFVVPRQLENEVVEVVLLPLGSKRFLSDQAIEQLIEEAARRAKEQVRPGGKPGTIDLSRYLQEWAVKYGFGYREVEAQVERWAAEVERQRDDNRKLALAAFIRRDFLTAARYASDSAELRLRRLAEVRRWRKSLEGEAARDLRLEAEAHARRGDYQRALAVAEQALRYVSREEDPRAWAALKLEQGRASLELAVRAREEESWWHLENARYALRQALEVPGSQAQDSLQRAQLLLREQRAPPGTGARGLQEQLGDGCTLQEGYP
jgi:tetratricopeptide (TPR) repeat protein